MLKAWFRRRRAPRWSVVFLLVLLLGLSVIQAAPIGAALSTTTPETPAIVADLPPAPARPPLPAPEEHARGYVQPPFDMSHLDEQPVNALRAAAYPSSWDWRDQGKVTRVQNQDTCGACYAFATLGSWESQLLIQEPDSAALDFSENHAIECNYMQTGCLGDTIWGLTGLFSAHGAVLEVDDPWNPADQACNQSAPYAKTATDMWVLAGSSTPPVDTLKGWLYTYGPLYVAMDAGEWPSNWANELQNFDGSYTLYYPVGQPELNHAVLLVGWDDDLAHAGGKGAWIVKNSWGTDWGDGGYLTIAYGSAGLGSEAALIRGWTDYMPNSVVLHHDEAGVRGWVGYDGVVDAWGMARLVPDRNGYVTHVGLWTRDRMTDLDVYLYDSFNGQATTGLLRPGIENVTLDYAGYHSIPIEPPLRVSNGNDVYVKVKFGYSGAMRGLPVDNQSPIAAHGSYISPNGADGSWTDLSAGEDLSPLDIGIRMRVVPSVNDDPTATPTSVPPTATATPQVTPTATTPANTPTPRPTVEPGAAGNGVVLPFIANRWPPVPYELTLNSIANADEDGSYTVSWGAASLAQTCELQEDDNPAFGSPTMRYTGSGTSYGVAGQSPGIWYYRVRGRNAHGPGPWSNVQSVRVRPPFMSLTRYAAPSDTTLESMNPDTWYGDYVDLWVGYGPDPELAAGVARSILYFDLSAIPQGATIQSAILQPYLYWYVHRSGYSGDMTISAHRVTAAWPAEPTWNRFASAYGEAYGSDVARTDFEYLHLDVTGLVQGWVNGTWPNDGVMLRGSESGYDNLKGFASADEADAWPQLVVQYYSDGQALQTEVIQARPPAQSESARTRELLQQLDSDEWEVGSAR